ncbi:uncharacterized protein LOC142938526 [Anarhichas minor]|uniref:uncharacterized protein LOC142938526 n=1 Tax=Anarhichas minor TaxID=65739 RepID=UPI003F73BC52
MEDKRCSDTKRLLTYWKAADPTTPPDAVGLPEVLQETDFKTTTTPRPDNPVYTPSVLTEAHGQTKLPSPPPPYDRKKCRIINPSLLKPSIQAPVHRVNGGTLDMDVEKVSTPGSCQDEAGRMGCREEEETKKKQQEWKMGSGEYKTKGYLFLKPRNRRRAATSDDDTLDDTDTEDRREGVCGAAGGCPLPRRSSRKRKEPECYADWFCPVRGEMPPLAQTQQYPLLVKSNGQAEFVPWGHRDMDALEKALPPLAGGANPWIRLFEKHTAADKLALGDIRAMIIRAEGTAQLTALEVRTGTTNRGDETSFDTFRGVFWRAMRSIWATKPNMNSLSGLKIKPEEETHQYLKRAEEEWHRATGGRHDSNEATTVVWRHTVQKGLPLPVQTALGGVVGLSNMEDAMWREHLTHYNQRHQTEETSGQEDLKRMTRQLLKLQIAEADREISRKHQAKKQMVIAEAQASQQPQNPAEPAPTVVYYQPPPHYRGRGHARAFNRGRGNYRGGYERPVGRGECYICGSESHWVRDWPQRAGGQFSASPQWAPFPPHQQYSRPGLPGPPPS